MPDEIASSPIDRELDNISRRVRTESIALLLDHWRAVKGPLMIPGRRQIDPTAFSSILSRVWLCDHELDTDRFRYRLTGERVAQRFGHRLSKRYLDDNTDPDYYPRVHRYYRNVVDLPAVLYIYGRLYAETEAPIHGERIVLPLSDDGRTVQTLIGATEELPASRNAEERYLPDFQKHLYVTLETGAIIGETLPV